MNAKNDKKTGTQKVADAVQGGTQPVQTDAVGQKLKDQLDGKVTDIERAAIAADAALNFSLDDLGEELSQVVVDVQGYWDPERSPIFGKLMGVAKAIETDLGVTGIYAVQLLKPCAGRIGASQESEPCVLPEGTIVGVFHSFGLNPLKNMAGAKVAIKRTAKVTLSDGKREMWTYDIRADRTRGKLDIIDNRAADTSGAPF